MTTLYAQSLVKTSFAYPSSSQYLLSPRDRLLRPVLAVVAAISMTAFCSLANAATAEDLNADAAQALQTLYKTNSIAESISKKAKAILVFPKVTKAGIVFGGSYGEGVLMKGATVSGYYNSVSASWGWQAGAVVV